MQDLDDVGSVFETLDFHSATGFMRIVNLECKTKVLVAEEVQEKDEVLDVDRKTDDPHDRRLLQDQRCSGGSHQHERLAHDRVDQRQSQEVRSDLDGT